VTEKTDEKDKLTRCALFLVMGAALTLGTWSIYTLLTARFHAPVAVALFGAIMFDAAALFFARLAQTYATSPDSGLFPRLAMLAMICISSWVNWQHALLEHWGRVGCVILAGAPIVSELAFELYHRYVHREALRAQGRVPSALPVLGKWAWILHPKQAFKVVDTTVEARLAVVADDAQRIILGREAPHQIEAPHQAEAPAGNVMLPEYLLRHLVAASPVPQLPEAAPSAADAPAEAPDQPHDAPLQPAAPRPVAAPASPPVQRPTAPPVKRGAPPTALHLTGLTKAAAVRAVRDAHPAASSTEISLHLEEHGITAEPNYIRTVLSRDTKPKGQTHGNGGYL
jgi:putative flippase GtrA